jgi:uncharacterized Zn finger protein (UPF0148 family)
MPTDKHDHRAGAHSDQQEEQIEENCAVPSLRLRTGITCPRCKTEKLDYDGMLQLFCPRCGVLEIGVFT